MLFMDSIEVVPLDAFVASTGFAPNRTPDLRPVLHEADVIFAVDYMTGLANLMYGREALADLEGPDGLDDLNILAIGVDRDSEDVEKLLAIVWAEKGEDAYDDEAWQMPPDDKADQANSPPP